MDKPVFKLEVFEGPLDLLLSSSPSTRSIFTTFHRPCARPVPGEHRGHEAVDLDVASEFLTMAAYLLYIKSQTLLPKHEEEEEDPRENLVRMLLEYQRYKAVAAGLQELYTKDCCRAVRAQQEPEADGAYRRRALALRARVRIRRHL